MYSSGTTGRPKGVMLTHANMVAHTLNAHDGWEFEPGDKCMVSMPLFHVGGSSYVLFPINDGVPSLHDPRPGRCLAGRRDPQRRQPDLPGAGGAGPGAAGRAGRGEAVRGAQDLHLRRRADAAAAAARRDGGLAGHRLPAGLRPHRGGRRGHPAARPTTTAPPSPTGTPSGWSRPAGRSPGSSIRIVDPATLEDLPVGEHGEIWMRTPQLFKGYLGKPEETAAGDHRGRLVPHRRHGQGRRGRATCSSRTGSRT